MTSKFHIKRNLSTAVPVGNVIIGGDAPILIQSMTNTDTADIETTSQQIAELAQAGSELVRVTVDRDKSAAAVPHIRDKLAKMNINVPLIGDFHYIGHTLLANHPACAEALAKYRINPGNVGFNTKRDIQFASMIEQALRYDKPVRIGVNWGSLDQSLLTSLTDKNAHSENPKDYKTVIHETIIQSALLSAKYAEKLGMNRNQIIISAKTSNVQDLIIVYNALAAQSEYALHLGLTEAGIGTKGIVASSSAMGILLQQGIGDTIRFSLTPQAGGARTREVEAACALLQTMGLRAFAPTVTACPGCGRTTSIVFQELAQNIHNYLNESMPTWREKYPGVEKMTVAVMGCIVNGPGESKHADIGISLPGIGEAHVAPVFINGKKDVTLHGPSLTNDFKEIIGNYVQQRYGRS